LRIIGSSAVELAQDLARKAATGDDNKQQSRRTASLEGRSRICERSQDLRSSLPDVTEAFRQDLDVAVPELNVVGRRRTRF
jgi:hypothetical protein